MEVIHSKMSIRADLQMRSQSVRDYRSVTDLIISKRDDLLSWLVFALISFILAKRVLYIAPDDHSYVAVFDGIDTLISSDWWSYFLSEPLWVVYATLIASIFDAETSLRITLFISSLMFLLATNKLARGAWVFILLAFMLDPTLATQIYYNQIRQGFALSLLLTVVAIGLSPLWGSLLASAIHSSFLLLIPCAALAILGKKSNNRLMIGTLVLLSLIFLLRPLFDTLDLGRRADTYELKGVLNIYFYVIAILQYGPTLLLLRNLNNNGGNELWLNFAWIATSAILFLTFFHEASARYICVVNTFLVVVIGLNLKKGPANLSRSGNAIERRSILDLLNSERARICAVLWLIILSANQLNESIKADFGQDSWVGRWMLILGE